MHANNLPMSSCKKAIAAQIKTVTNLWSCPKIGLRTSWGPKNRWTGQVMATESSDNSLTGVWNSFVSRRHRRAESTLDKLSCHLIHALEIELHKVFLQEERNKAKIKPSTKQLYCTFEDKTNKINSICSAKSGRKFSPTFWLSLLAPLHYKTSCIVHSGKHDSRVTCLSELFCFSSMKI